MLGGNIMLMFDAKVPRTTFTTAGSGKEKEKPRENVETVSEQVQGVAQWQGMYTIV